MSKSLALEDGDDIFQSFFISLTVYLKVRKAMQGKMSSKEEKSTKMKELLFTLDNSNYLEFLHSILLKHGLKNHKVTEKKHFPLKQWTSNAIDVDNLSDCREMVKKISNDSLPVMKIFVDM
ncbi:hypothetical protein EDC04DRAFT_2895098 [Pisolithus marmoratus]|nr:hypothetical protein EDC04DRAFT_2895098 [Pisolithus marmoratus]